VHASGLGDVAHLPSMHETLSSIPSTKKKKKMHFLIPKTLKIEKVVKGKKNHSSSREIHFIFLFLMSYKKDPEEGF
jgi:hypothetical protein